DRTEANPNELNQDDARYGFRCCHLKNIWTAPLLPETELSRQMTTSTTSIDIMGLQAAYANLHTDQERDRSEERFSGNAETERVCRLLLEKKKTTSKRPSEKKYKIKSKLRQLITSRTIFLRMHFDTSID